MSLAAARSDVQPLVQQPLRAIGDHAILVLDAAEEVRQLGVAVRLGVGDVPVVGLSPCNA
jgi:hypothetical protein